MKKLLALLLVPTFLSAQVVGKTQTEEYRASFEKKVNIDSLMDYDGPKIPIQLLNIGINEEVFAMYPELKDKRVGLGVTNIVVEYLEETIKLAEYFVYIEVYDFSVSEDETINMKDGVKNKVVTRLGLQVKFVDAETGEYFTGSGLGEAKTVRELTIMNDDNFGEIKFNQSTIGTTTKKALEDASAKIVTRMVRKGLFKK